jgi:xanthine dehydrogenase accessory factor
MRDVVSDIDLWLKSGSPVVLATVLETWGSAPRQVGAKMAMTAEGLMTGSVSGGCVEGAVFDSALEVLVSRAPQLLSFGIADETAWDVGLACGGSIEVFVEPLDPLTYNFINELLDKNESFATVTIISGQPDLIGKKLVVQRGGRVFGQISSDIDGLVAAAARTTLASGESERQRFEIPDSELAPLDLFIEVLQPAPSLVTIGGVHIATALTSIASNLGYQTVVIDPRRAFGSVSLR